MNAEEQLSRRYGDSELRDWLILERDLAHYKCGLSGAPIRDKRFYEGMAFAYASVLGKMNAST